MEWGWLDPGDSSWDAGESHDSCIVVSGMWECTPGPAEGVWYYEDGRSFDFSDEIETYWPAHFRVSRRAQDTDQTATFTVRVEHDREWVSPRHAHWPVDPVTGKRYFDFPLTLTGNQQSVVVRIEVLDNGRPTDWSFSARILPVTDSTTGSQVVADTEAEYWTVAGLREQSHQVRDEVASLQVDLLDPVPATVPEGGQVEFGVQRLRGYVLEPLTIQVRTWEPNRTAPDGTNPTERIHTLVFPAQPLTSEWIKSRSLSQTQHIVVTTAQDASYEPSDDVKAQVLSVGYPLDHRSRISVEASIVDDDRADISLAADKTSITEGEAVSFTLTRGNNTTEGLIVGVSVEDPGGFLQGNFPSEAVTVPSSITFAPGDVTASVTITPPDDWRDIPDSTLTFTVEPDPAYEIATGAGEVTVDVADDDVAPQVGISFNYAEVDEGDDLILTITRTGEDKNPIEVPVTVGPVGNQSYHVFGMGRRRVLVATRVHPARRLIQGAGHPIRGHTAPGTSRILGPRRTDHGYRRNPGQRPIRRGDSGIQDQRRRGTAHLLPGHP